MKITMKTPICDFVERYAKQNALRLHMPGHKGKGPMGIEALDITEIDGADVLYHGNGVIRQSEENAAALFGSARTLYSTEGSSLSIRAMLYLAVMDAKARKKKPLIWAGRNAHQVFMTAAALLDLPVKWLYSEQEESMIACTITAEGLRRALSEASDKPTAVYLTSPDYLGNSLDLTGIARVCHANDVLLLVDHAHGAYLKFLEPSRHPMDLGADLCCDSAHKTLPVLTGGAYLHVAHSAPPLLSEYAEQAMALFASTSPSYLILESLDAANRYLADGYQERLRVFTQAVAEMKTRLTDHGYSLIGNEPLKLTVAPKSLGYTGDLMAEQLRREGIVCEFYDRDFVTMMLTPDLPEGALTYLERTLTSVEKRAPLTDSPPRLSPQTFVLSMREALLAPHCVLPIDECRGRILAESRIACPPAIPIVVCGERMDESAIRCMKYYGVDTCRVVKENV